MKVEAKSAVLLLFLTCGVVLVKAHIGELDEYWKSRAEKAQKDALDAYTVNPLEVTDQLNADVEE